MKLGDGIFLLLLVGFVMSCGRYDRKSPTFSATARVSQHFSSIYSQVIAPRCLSCHGEGGTRPNLTGYSEVRDSVVAGDPSRSRLYRIVEDGSMPQGGAMLSDDEIFAISLWIQNGAPND